MCFLQGDIVRLFLTVASFQETSQVMRDHGLDIDIKIGLPIGIGAMEGTIRRVVNIRLKGAAIYRLEQSAEAILLLRSFYKSGHWRVLSKLVLSACCEMFVESIFVGTRPHLYFITLPYSPYWQGRILYMSSKILIHVSKGNSPFAIL